ncbi:MAG: exodeoxyribonuclease VII large subunit [Deltaproteobacteria bacterium]|nr:exodeoxyribonuclease VII large subunit [Deltaproteobacteria bacterium]
MENLQLFTPREILTVSALLGRLKGLVEQSFDFVWVEGEVSALRRPASGHVYFSLKDDHAVLKMVLFRHQASLLRFRLEEGQQVLCQGRVSLYEPRGDLQMVVDTVEPRGAGGLALAFEQLKKRLAAEGLFDPERKQPLPELPTRVAVVTSPSGAAIRDFLHVLHRRYQGISVAVYPVQVQGAEAAPQMVRALADLAAWGWPQVVVLTRGGGSPEDLWAFNDEALARAIAACPLPVVSAVGHEVDFTISDLVADLRAPTPSAAAELLTKDRAELVRRLNAAGGRLAAAGGRLLVRRRVNLGHLLRGLGDPRRRLADRRLRVDDLFLRQVAALRLGLGENARGLAGLVARLREREPGRRLAGLAARQDQATLRLTRAGADAVWARRQRLEVLESRLRALSPLAVLGRGFALVRDQRGKIVKDNRQVQVGQRVGVLLSRGSFSARVEEVEE